MLGFYAEGLWTTQLLKEIYLTNGLVHRNRLTNRSLISFGHHSSPADWLLCRYMYGMFEVGSSRYVWPHLVFVNGQRNLEAAPLTQVGCCSDRHRLLEEHLVGNNVVALPVSSYDPKMWNNISSSRSTQWKIAAHQIFHIKVKVTL